MALWAAKLNMHINCKLNRLGTWWQSNWRSSQPRNGTLWLGWGWFSHCLLNACPKCDWGILHDSWKFWRVLMVFKEPTAHWTQRSPNPELTEPRAHWHTDSIGLKFNLLQGFSLSILSTGITGGWPYSPSMYMGAGSVIQSSYLSYKQVLPTGSAPQPHPRSLILSSRMCLIPFEVRGSCLHPHLTGLLSAMRIQPRYLDCRDRVLIGQQWCLLFPAVWSWHLATRDTPWIPCFPHLWWLHYFLECAVLVDSNLCVPLPSEENHINWDEGGGTPDVRLWNLNVLQGPTQRKPIHSILSVFGHGGQGGAAPTATLSS